MGLSNRSAINNAHAYETIQYMKTLKLGLSCSQSTALHYLIRDIGIANFNKSTLKQALLNKDSSVNRIRGAWLALKRVEGMDIKTAIGRRFDELKLWSGGANG